MAPQIKKQKGTQKVLKLKEGHLHQNLIVGMSLREDLTAWRPIIMIPGSALVKFSW